MENFTPVSALVGGLLIGGSATLLLFLNGRIAGVSSIARGVLEWKPDDYVWRVLFLAGLVAGAGLFFFLFWNAPVPPPGFPVWLLGAGGALGGVGGSFGARPPRRHRGVGVGR